jgi:hypothetical protein
MKLFIETLVRENYATHNWDGQGEAPQYWKCKGGSTYVVENAPLDVDALKALVAKVAPHIEQNDDYYFEQIVNWYVESDDFKTEFEEMQEEYDGHITFRPGIIDPDTGTIREQITMEAA